MEDIRHFSAGGAVISYGRRGAAHPSGQPPLLLIHGAASNMTRWQEFSEATVLAETHDLLRLDLRGHARSLSRGHVSLDIWCDDIAALLRHEGTGRAILVGHCLGANIAALFASRYPKQTAGLVLVEPMPSTALKAKLKGLRRFSPLLRAAITLIQAGNRLGLYRRHLEPLDLRALDRELRAHLGTPEEKRFLRQRYGSAWQDLKTLPAAVFLSDLLEVLRPLPWTKIRAPMLVLVSVGQAFVDVGKTHALIADLPEAEVRAIEAEHWIPAEQPQAMREAIESWVAGHDWGQAETAHAAPRPE